MPYATRPPAPPAYTYDPYYPTHYHDARYPSPSPAQRSEEHVDAYATAPPPIAHQGRAARRAQRGSMFAPPPAQQY